MLGDALVLADGRWLADHELLERAEPLPAGILTVVLDCSFGSGLESLLLLPDGEVEAARIKRWIPPDPERLRQHRESLGRARSLSPFGFSKPATSDALLAGLSGVGLDPAPARVTALADPAAKAVIVCPCLEDENALDATSQTAGVSAFTYCLLASARRLGPNRSAIEVIQTAGHELRRLGIRQTPTLKEPLQPEHLGLRAFLTFQPALFVYSPTPGGEAEDPLTRSIAEAIRNAFDAAKEGRSMHATMAPGQMTYGDDIGTIVNTVTPIVASVLQARGYQPYAPPAGWSQPAGGFGQQQLGLGFPSPMGGGLQPHEIAHIASTVTPLVLSLLQARSPYAPFGQPPFASGSPWSLGSFGAPVQSGWGLPWGGYGQPGFGFTPTAGMTLAPHEISQIVGVLTPVVTSILQTRSYQMHAGQGLPRAA